VVAVSSLFICFYDSILYMIGGSTTLSRALGKTTEATFVHEVTCFLSLPLVSSTRNVSRYSCGRCVGNVKKRASIGLARRPSVVQMIPLRR
jgi:hypothetical protein